MFKKKPCIHIINDNVALKIGHLIYPDQRSLRTINKNDEVLLTINLSNSFISHNEKGRILGRLSQLHYFDKVILHIDKEYMTIHHLDLKTRVVNHANSKKVINFLVIDWLVIVK